ncbi:Alpha/Beta hydrolase protein [Coniochaeta sp. 2T2.1]|nr:Alpha/Beta hydrolase protein [Coniochaeta sp. 2T2.1]
MFEQNPNIIQETPQSLSHLRPPPTPLVLIHDGGGTIYSYYCLGGLARPVYGIYNPHYGTDKVWAGGIPEMAAHYTSLIKAAIPKGGDVILGGWSLGGLLSLEVARILAEDGEWMTNNRLNVLGIVMIDSIYPRAPSFQKLGHKIVQHVAEWSENTKQETKDAVQRCFDEAVRMVGEWELPRWEEAHDKEMKPPPVWLLRAEKAVPVLEEGGVSRVDTYRGERYLGWDQYRRDMVFRVEDVPGHHFNIFGWDHIDAVTEKLKKACGEIEDWGRRKNGEPLKR